MAYASSDTALVADSGTQNRYTVAALRSAFSTYMRKRRIYDRTLTELHSYSRRDLLDLGIDPDGLHDLARRAAGW